MTIIETCEAAQVRYIDHDTFDVANIEVDIRPGWELVGDTGWVNDHGWNDIAWGTIDPSLAHLEAEACVPENEMPALPDGYAWLVASHGDDDPDNAGTSNTCSWWITYVFRRVETEK